MYKYDLSIILPSIRTELLETFYSSISASVGDYRYELIVVGPYNLPTSLQGTSNVKYIKDFGSPSRCLQMGTLLAEGEYMTWASDDGTYTPNSLSECLDLYSLNGPGRHLQHKDGVIIRYWEADNKQGSLPDDSYWKAWTHADQRLPGIPEHYYCCPVGLYNTAYYISMGGIDCAFRHINMNAHSLAFRVQNDGGHFHLSPSCVLECDFDNVRSALHRPLDIAYANIDRPLYMQLYSQPFNPHHKQIPYDSWMRAPTVWERFQ